MNINDFYLKCPKCGKTVYVNHYCGEWNNTNCNGDPWGTIKDTENEILRFERKRDKYLKMVENLNDNISERIKHLPKNHPKRKIYKSI